jgi:hypothetical protein
MGKTDERPLQLLAEMAEFEKKRKARFEKVVWEADKQYYPGRSVLPKLSNSGKVIWPLQRYYSKWKHRAKSFVEVVDARGGFFRVYDPVKHYFHPVAEKIPGTEFDILTEEEYYLLTDKD